MAEQPILMVPDVSMELRVLDRHACAAQEAASRPFATVPSWRTSLQSRARRFSVFEIVCVFRPNSVAKQRGHYT